MPNHERSSEFKRLSVFGHPLVIRHSCFVIFHLRNFNHFPAECVTDFANGIRELALRDCNIICDDVVNYKIEKDQTAFFFFNPFDEVVMLKVVKNILSSLKEHERKIYVIYANPVHKEIFLSAGFEEDFYLKKLHYLELSILLKEPGV